MMVNLCAPAIIYLIFSITQIIIDTLKGLYNTALMKIVISTMITILLNIMCQRGLSIISWIIVFIPFVLMTVIVTLLLYVFGLDTATGKINYSCDNKTNTIDKNGNIIIYAPEYNSKSIDKISYIYPNIIIPSLRKKTTQTEVVSGVQQTSDPAFQ